MAITRIKNNQITDNTIDANAKVSDFSITSNKLANNLTYGSDFTVSGNLTVSGQTTTIDTVSTVIEDPTLLLAKDQTGAPSVDIGIIGERGDELNVAMIWDESADKFVAVYTTDAVTNTTVSIDSYASFQAHDITANANLAVTGTSNLVGNITLGNVFIDGQKTVDMGNSIIGNVQDPVANSDVATKFYVDSQSASGFTIEDDQSNTTVVSGGDTLELFGTTDEVTVTVTGNDQVTFGLPANVTVADVLTVGGELFANGNIIPSTANIFTLGNASHRWANLFLTGSTMVIGNVQIEQTGIDNFDQPVLSIQNQAGNNSAAISVAGISVADYITAIGNVAGGNITTAGDVTTATVTASGNVAGGNLTTAGAVDATGNVAGGNLTTAGAVDATGNVTGGNLTTAGDVTTATVTASGNVAGGNLTTAGDVTTATVTASGNVAGGNLTTAGDVSGATGTFTGNVEVANLVATGDVGAATGTFTGDVSAANIDASTAVNTDLIAGTSVQVDSTGDIVLNPSGNINVSGQRIFNVSDPQLAFDAATKQYVDDAVSSGIHIHTPVDVETPTALPAATYANGGNTFTVNETIAGNTVVFTTAANLQVNDQLWFDNSFNGVVGNLVYFVVSTPNTSAAVLSTQYNGTPVSNITSASGLTESVRVNSGIGANLTANINGALTVDGFSVSAGNRVLVYNQSNQIENGVYDVTDAGNVSAPWILTRSSDADTYEPQTSTGLDQGSYFYVQYGDTGAGESYVKTAPAGPFIFGVVNIEFTQFSASQVYSANTQAGLALNGTVFSAKVDNDTTAFDGGGNIIVKASANLVTPNIGDATGNSLTLSGNGLVSATTGTFTGNVSGGNLTTAGDVTTATVTASGNVSGGNITTAGAVEATGNVSGGNITTAGDVTTATVTASGNVAGGNITTAGDVTTATVTASGNVAGGNITTAGDVTTATVTASGNVAGGNITTAGDVTTATVTASGNVAGGNLTTAGVVEATGNVVGGNITTAGVVEATGNVVGGNITTAGAVDATGNVSGGNITTAGAVDATGNVSGGNLIAAGDVSGATLTISGNIDGANLNATSGITAGTTVTATGNITGSNLTTAGDVTTATVTASGNVVGGNLTTAGDVTTVTVTASGNVSADNVLTDTVESATSITITAVSGDIVFSATGNIDAGNVNILNVASPVADSDAATKGYVDSVAQGLDVKASVLTATTGNLNAATGGVVSYNNGSSGVGATLTTTGTFTTIDDVSIATTGARVLVKDEATAAHNGIYVYTNSTTLTRATDFDASNEIPSAFTFVEEGTSYADTGWVCTTNAPVTVGTTNIGFTQFSGAGQYTAGDGLDLTGTVFSVNVDGTTIAIAADTLGIPEGASLPNVDIGDGTASSLDVTGNIVAGNIEANSAITAGTTVTATGNVSGGNIITAGVVEATGNVSGSNIITAGVVEATGNITGGNITTAGDVTTATVTASGNVTGGNLTTAGDVTTATVTASGNVAGGNITTAGDVTTATVTASGNVAGGNLTTAGDVTTATVTASGNISGANLDVTSGITAGTTVTATGNITGGNLTTAGDVTTVTVTASGNVAGGNITTAGDVTTATVTASGNISSANLDVTSGITAGTTVTATGNITGGNLTTAGDVTTVTVTASGNVVGGNISTAGIVVATGNITGGNITTAGDVTTATVTASGNVSADNVLTDTVESSGTLNLTAVSGDIVFSATGNIDAGNVNILNVAEPVSDSDAATKGYVDSVAQGLDVKASVRLATASALPAFTYDNGASGVGATITANANGALSVDGTTPSTGDRILIKNETTTNTPYNGIYVVTTVGDGSTSFVLTRATDFDNGSPSGEVPGAFTFVEEGATNADAGFVCTTDAPVTIGTTNITFSQFSGAGSIVAGDGLSKSGNELSVNVDGTTIAIAADTLGIPEGASLPNVDIGDGTASSLDVTGNIIAGNIEANSAITTTTLTASGNVTGGNLTTAGDVTTATVTASGNVTGGNLTTAGDVTTATVTASGNVAGGNITTAGVVEATGNVIGGNITTVGVVAATGNISSASNITTGGSVIGGQIITGGTVTATGNITGGNVISLGSLETLGNILANNAVITNSIDTDTLTATGNVLGDNVIATGTVEASGNVIGGNVVTTGTVSGVSAFFTGNIDGANLNATDGVSATSITATGNIEGGNLSSAGLIVSTGNIESGANISASGLIEAVGNVSGGNITTVGDVTTVTMTASGNISALGTSTLGNIIISGADITTDTGEITINDAAADINLRIKGENNNELFFVDAAANVVNIGNAAAVTGASFRVGTTDSILIPVGNTAQRPGTPATGMIRFNNQVNSLEFYDNDSWEAAGTTFTVIASETFNGDGSTTVFILSANHTTASCIVSINGVIQLPTTAYSVSNDTLTFTEAPLAGDVIEVRTLTTTTSIDKLANGAETAVLEASAGSADMFITGNLIPTGNVIQDLGSTANRFRDLYLSGSSITLGGVVLKDAGSSTFAVYELDGTTLATIDASINTTGNVSFGNLTVNTATSTNTLTASGNVDAGNLITTGVVTATGNITGGNLAIASAITSTTVSASGNVSGGNLTTVGAVSATGNVSGGNLVTSGNIVAGNLNVSGIEAVGTLNVSGDTTIVGNLTVSGTTITANVATLTVTDPILALGRGANGDPLTSNDGLDRGLELYYFTSSEQHAFIGYDNDAGKIISAANASIANNVVTVNSYGTTVVGTLEVGNIVNSNANGVGNIGSSTTFFNTVFAKATSAEYADLAEHYQSDDDYEPGTVVMFGGAQEITLCSIDGCQRVAGVISTNPSYVMNAGLTGEHTVVVALTGRVPTKVTGKVRKGDMMVSNGDGTARAEADPKIGSVIGKALADFDGETGVIEVVVGRL